MKAVTSRLFIMSVALVVALFILSCNASTETSYGWDDDDNDDDDKVQVDGDLEVAGDGDNELQIDGDSDNGVDGDVEDPLNMCGVGDFEKTPLVSTKIYSGTAEPTLYNLLENQKKAIGALIGRNYNWGNFCTATLIAPNVVLSAAHCVVGSFFNPAPSPADVKFAIGRDAKTPDYTFQVVEIHSNPAYTGSGSDPAAHDQCVLILGESVTDKIPDIQVFPYNTEVLPSEFSTSQVQNVGYGATNNSDGDNNSKRWWVAEDVYSVSNGSFSVYGNGTHGVCFGDSGGPSLFLINNRVTVVGTVSWGDESCLDEDHFARTDADSAWLMQYAEPQTGCGDVDEIGQCDGAIARWCDNGSLIEVDCREQGMTCGLNSESQQYRCVEDPCLGLDHKGGCFPGDIAMWCDDGQLKQRKCIPCQQVCDWAGSGYGYYCVDDPERGKSRTTLCRGTCDLSNDSAYCVGATGKLCVCSSLSEEWETLDCGDSCAAQSKGRGFCTGGDSGIEMCVCEEHYDPGQCGGLLYTGCCDGDLAKWCENGEVKSMDCMAEYGQSCGWVDEFYGYFCGGSGEDPGGNNPMSCSN